MNEHTTLSDPDRTPQQTLVGDTTWPVRTMNVPHGDLRLQSGGNPPDPPIAPGQAVAEATFAELMDLVESHDWPEDSKTFIRQLRAEHHRCAWLNACARQKHLWRGKVYAEAWRKRAEELVR
jgi:hypothetical protein